MKTLLFFCLQLITIAQTVGQCPTADFGIPSNACSGTRLQIDNLSSAAVSYSWDFCSGDLLNTPAASSITTLSGLSSVEGIEIVQDNGQWYGFATGRLSETIGRINFGSNLNNPTPGLTALGNPGNLLSRPTAPNIFFQNSTWYGLVLNSSDGNLILLTFGANLTNTPSAQIVYSNVGASGGSMDVVVDGDKVVVGIVKASDVITINFANGIAQPATSVNTTNISGAQLFDFALLEACGNWFGFAIDYNFYRIYRLSYGTDPSSAPTLTDITGSMVFNEHLYRIWVGREGGQFIGYVGTWNASSGGIYRIAFGNSLTNNPSSVALGDLGVLSNIWSLDITSSGSDWYGYTVNGATGSLYRLDFPQNCGASASVSGVTSPQNITYSSSGNYLVTLTAFDASGKSSSISKPISVSALQAPDIDFTSDGNICAQHSINFISSNSSGNIVNYSWDFGDSNASGLASPSHTYTTAANYTIDLGVSASNGCTNSASKNLQVYNAPQANFSLPSASPYCTNQLYTYTNASTYDNGSNPSWQWSVNGSNVTTTKNLDYLLTSSSSQSISLTASIPGCSTQSTKNLASLVDGPLISFNSSSTGCQNSVIAFTNTTTDQVTGFSWAFGDGNLSSSANASNIYTSSGSFQVKLTATNANGCQNSYSKNITIYSQPQPNFAIEAPPLSCERSPSQLDNLTPALVDSNISSWSWSLGDANNGSSTLKNPTYTYASAGSYNVSLLATSNFGCSKSIQKSITISPSPVANFTNLAACVNQGTRFTDASSGSVSFYQWTIQSNILSGSTPSYTFKSSGTFPITLTTTSPNGCTNQITKNVVVPVLPVVDFTVQAPCTGHPSVFRETNPDTADPAVAWNWNFGQASGTGSPVSYQFTSEGGHTVTMSTTRQSGCVYSTSENISISAGPIASFTPSIFAGAAPLSVSFNNNSTADSYQWSFGDQAQTTSTSNSPSFTYTTLGKYKPLLTAKNNLGCSDTLSTEIYVVIPHVDVAMNNLSLTNDLTSNTSKPVVTILNSGNMPLIDPVIILDLGGGASIKQKVSGMVKPGKSLSKMLELQIVPSSIKYVCAEIEAADDVNLYNNRQCVSLSHENLVMQPYPNPAISGHVTLEWIGASQENATVTVFRSNGEIVFEQHLDRLQAGLGQLEISTSSLPNGLYLIRFVGSTVTKTFRIVIAN